MTDLKSLTPGQLHTLKDELEQRYQRFKSSGQNLDMTRGKPSTQQLDLSSGLLDCVNAKRFTGRDGLDCRNYGGLDGIPEAKALFAAYLDVGIDEIIVGGNSSLNLMHDTVLRAMVKGVSPDHPPWGSTDKIAFLCPSPGYDRHFFVCEHLGIDMIPVEMTDSGPDMDTVASLVAAEEHIKGIWCVPRYSNPTGVVYTDDVVRQLAEMPTKAPDFRLFWDNAYNVHHLTDHPRNLMNILDACKRAGNPDRVFIFGSTSKITFAGSGLAMLAGSAANMQAIKNHMGFQTIGPDKLNQLRHVRFLQDLAGIHAHMKKHTALLKPKFDAVRRILKTELAGTGAATWSRPEGGYFVSLDTMDGCARKVVAMAAEAGVKLTPAGATFPYKQDPRDRNIRIAPSFPAPADIEAAVEMLAICTKLAAIETLL